MTPVQLNSLSHIKLRYQSVFKLLSTQIRCLRGRQNLNLQAHSPVQLSSFDMAGEFSCFSCLTIGRTERTIWANRPLARTKTCDTS